MKRYILNTLLLLLPFYGVVAQKMDRIKWVSHFEALTESEEYNDTCVLDKDSVHHAIRGARRVIEFSSENYTIEWFSSTIVVNDEKRSHNVMEKTNSISFHFLISFLP